MLEGGGTSYGSLPGKSQVWPVHRFNPLPSPSVRVSRDLVIPCSLQGEGNTQAVISLINVNVSYKRVNFITHFQIFLSAQNHSYSKEAYFGVATTPPLHSEARISAIASFPVGRSFSHTM